MDEVRIYDHKGNALIVLGKKISLAGCPYHHGSGNSWLLGIYKNQADLF